MESWLWRVAGFRATDVDVDEHLARLRLTYIGIAVGGLIGLVLVAVVALLDAVVGGESALRAWWASGFALVWGGLMASPWAIAAMRRSLRKQESSPQPAAGSSGKKA